MPDELAGQALDRQASAIANVDGFIARSAGGERLPADALEQYRKRGYTMGWRVRVNFSDGVRRELHVLTDNAFPYTAPRVAVADGPDVLAWPHLEREGLLCILPTDAAVSWERPAGVVELVLGEACRLIENCIRGENRDDFRQEFLSYWMMAVNQSAVRFISLIEPQGPGRRVVIWRGKGGRVVADNHEILRRWLPRWGTQAGKGQDYKLHDGVMVWLSEPLLPVEYPATAADVRALAQERSPAAADVLENLAASSADEISVLLGAPTAHGACFGAVTVWPPMPIGGPRKKGNPLVAGFRPGHVPRDLLVNRYLSKVAKVTKATVERADHLWIHGRDQDTRQGRLLRVRVAVLGCGSLGGPLARLLAQSGIGRQLLVDYERMDWPNVSRHELGARSVGRYKAQYLAGEIERAYPHLEDVSWRRDKFGPATTGLIGELRACDLIVSAMGNWAAESFLNDVQRDIADFPSILYGWVETNAAAAHAVLVPPGDACLRCGVDDKGRPHLAVSQWERDRDMLQEPACGAQFTPYGPAELCWAHALLAEMVIEALTSNFDSAVHRVWIGMRSRINAASGAWSEDWISEVGDPGMGGITVERKWAASAGCPVCNRGVSRVIPHSIGKSGQTHILENPVLVSVNKSDPVTNGGYPVKLLARQ